MSPFAFALLAQALVLGWLLSQPLYWAFHFEYALAANLAVLIIGGAGAIGALSHPRPLTSEIARAGGRILASLALAFVLPLLAQVIVGSCDTSEGIAWFALIPGVGSVLVLGEVLCLRSLGASRRRMLVLHALVILGAALVMGARAYFGLSFRLYNVFLGYWPGVLYDEFVPIEMPILIARAQALLLAAGLVALGGGIVLRRHVPRIAGVVFLALFALSFVQAARVGIHPWRGTVAEELGVTFEGRYVTWYADVDSPRVRRDLPLLAARADYQAERVAERLGIDPVPQMSVFLFASAESKRRVIGAAHTVVTRPWKRELYLHMSSRTHDVLRHELVHLVSAGWAYPGVGISPNIAMLEGLAVSQQEDLDEGYSAQGLARAVLEEKPDFDLAAFLSGAAFWSLSPRVAYPMAGAFVSFLLDSNVLQGPLEDFYRTGSPEGQDIAELADAWRAELDKAPEPTGPERALARRVLAARPLHEKRCAHEVAECLHVASGGMWTGEGGGSPLELVTRALALDPNRPDVRAFEFHLEAAGGALEKVKAALPADPQSEEPPTYEQLAAAEIYADHQMAAGEFDAALPWLDYSMRWSSEVSEFWKAWVSRELAANGGAISLERSDGAWSLRCELALGRASCTEADRVLSVGGEDLVEEASILLFDDPRVEFAAAHEQYRGMLLTARAAEAEKWAARMAQVEGISEVRRARALNAEAEASWLAGAFETYARNVKAVLP